MAISIKNNNGSAECSVGFSLGLYPSLIILALEVTQFNFAAFDCNENS